MFDCEDRTNWKLTYEEFVKRYHNRPNFEKISTAVKKYNSKFCLMDYDNLFTDDGRYMGTAVEIAIAYFDRDNEQKIDVICEGAWPNLDSTLKSFGTLNEAREEIRSIYYDDEYMDEIGREEMDAQYRKDPNGLIEFYSEGLEDDND